MRINLRRQHDVNAMVGMGLGGVALGAALAWLMDPARGARRRSLLKDKALSAARTVSEAADVSARDIVHRTRGAKAGLRARVAEFRDRMKDEPVDDRVLAERVRARLGRLSAHPGAIEVIAREGSVQLTGPVLQAEVDRVIRGVCRVRGVVEIDDRLDVHESAGDVPALQGGDDDSRATEAWTPTTRTLAGATGTGLLAFAAVRRDALGAGAGLAGLGLLVRSMTNEPALRAAGIGAGRRVLDIRKSIRVEAPVEEVYEFFSEFENFPRFMAHVREVARQGDDGDRWRWTVSGPAGLPVSWEAQVTRQIPNEVIAWRSVEGSPIRNGGVVRFGREREGTRVDIRMSYNPPGGRIGHALSAALGANPRRQLDDDMVRFKSLLETGKATGRDETVTKEELEEERP